MSATGPDKLRRLLDEAVARLSAARRTFTDEEEFGAIWEAGYDIFPQSDLRFVLARETDGRHPRHWRLEGQVLANNRLLDALQAGTWDGRELDAELARMSEEDKAHYVFCPVDPRFQVGADGTLGPAEREKDVPLDDPVRAELDQLLAPLLDRWKTEGGAPRTVRQIASTVAELGWPHATERGGWLLIRAWLLLQPSIRRVGRDYWAPTECVPGGPARTRLNVIPVFSAAKAPSASTNQDEGPAGGSERGQAEAPEQIPIPPDLGAVEVRWVAIVRTVHLTEGFIPVPAPHRCAYPPRAKQANDCEVLRGKWFDTGDELWVWLDRRRDLLYGPDLADRLAWCEAGERIGVLWASEVIVFQSLGVLEDVRREETRLADRDALADLRGGLGESYHRSLTAILGNEPQGLTFRELVTALTERQKHEVHRGTVRAILHAGGFICRDNRWCVAPDAAAGVRRLRRTVAGTLLQSGTTSDEAGPPPVAPLSELARAVKAKLKRIVAELAGCSPGTIHSTGDREGAKTENQDRGGQSRSS